MLQKTTTERKPIQGTSRFHKSFRALGCTITILVLKASVFQAFSMENKISEGFQLNAGDTLVFASHNHGKIRELSILLKSLNLKITSSGELKIEAPEETGITFVENSQLKALAVAQASGEMALADDMGLCVEALNGEPGVYSAEFAEIKPGGPRDFPMAFQKLFDRLSEVKALPPYRATMVCVLSLADPQGKVQSYEGIIEGEISMPPRGENGFGYDPIFTPDGHSQTYGQMEPILKSQISKRRRAIDFFLKSVCALSFASSETCSKL